MHDDLYELLIHLMEGDMEQAEQCFADYIQIKTTQLLEGGRFLSKEEAEKVMKDASTKSSYKDIEDDPDLVAKKAKKDLQKAREEKESNKEKRNETNSYF